MQSYGICMLSVGVRIQTGKHYTVMYVVARIQTGRHYTVM